MGSATALSLKDRGHRVTLFDPHPPEMGRGSSHGRSRIVRRAYPDPFYTGVMQAAYPMWGDLERRSGAKLLHECGLLYFGEESSETLCNVASSLAEHGVRHEVWDAGKVNAQSGLRLRGTEVGIWTPEAGWVHAEAAIQACRLTADVAPIHERVDPFELLQRFDRVAVCVGAWTAKWFAVDVQVTRQTFAYFGLEQPWEGPVWIEDSADFLYGFPSEPGVASVKIGVHRPGSLQDPDDPDRTPDPARVNLMGEFVRQRLGGSGRAISAHGCLYTTTPDEDFRFGEVEGRLFWASPCSGHGFKFGLWVGCLMASFLEGSDHPQNWPRFNTPSSPK